jgi:dihydropteroate synthase
VDRARIAIDPGLGFGKRKEQNAEILARLAELAMLEFPLVVGPSRKSFLPQLEKPSEGFLQCATAAAVTAAILGGAHLLRVHDVLEMKAAALVADQIFSFAGTSDSNASPAGPPRSGGSAFRR